MAKFYDYKMAVWLRIDEPCTADKLHEYLEAKYQILKLETVDESESEDGSDPAFSIQVRVTFNESQMDGTEPTDDAIRGLDEELRSYLQEKYPLEYFELLDDALTSHLLAEWEES